eukprot:gnl/TRDRNA2_/TRDRNA2_161312_c1_seq2.p1 gnl/TRDRNA2_/TRDRNA2_161312_c1~~gnl/TRDRNA2_/TRDRNA2_161312_c1_seq2.p1  ORF type:complete len:362 (+),score=44.62 gnl/TRDRNA2_/TRDRNA2_161312_c1_seq2:26-1111(+)
MEARVKPSPDFGPAKEPDAAMASQMPTRATVRDASRAYPPPARDERRRPSTLPPTLSANGPHSLYPSTVSGADNNSDNLSHEEMLGAVVASNGGQQTSLKPEPCDVTKEVRVSRPADCPETSGTKTRREAETCKPAEAAEVQSPDKSVRRSSGFPSFSDADFVSGDPAVTADIAAGGLVLPKTGAAARSTSIHDGSPASSDDTQSARRLARASEAAELHRSSVSESIVIEVPTAEPSPFASPARTSSTIYGTPLRPSPCASLVVVEPDSALIAGSSPSLPAPVITEVSRTGPSGLVSPPRQRSPASPWPSPSSALTDQTAAAPANGQQLRRSSTVAAVAALRPHYYAAAAAAQVAWPASSR